jgi:hypothetical protein
MWVDGFRQPWDIWTLSRRTGGQLQKMQQFRLLRKQLCIYHRYTFPITEQDYNFDNWLAATNNQDLFATKTWLENKDGLRMD